MKICSTCKYSAACLADGGIVHLWYCPVCERLHGCFESSSWIVSMPTLYFDRSCPEVIHYLTQSKRKVSDILALYSLRCVNCPPGRVRWE